MARPVSGLRVARSLLTPEGAQVLTQEIDFQLGARMGIEIHGIYGGISGAEDASVAALDDSITTRNGLQTVHLETGVVEDPLDSAAEDAFDIDTEIIWRQDITQSTIWTSVVTEGAGLAYIVTPVNTVWFPEPIQSARNITHRAEAVVADGDFRMNILIYFKYIQFSLREMGVLMARRT